MKIIEILEFNRELLENFQNLGLKLSDCQYIDMYNEYIEMRKQSLKVTYIIAQLADKYSISERKVYSLLGWFDSDYNHCKKRAV